MNIAKQQEEMIQMLLNSQKRSWELLKKEIKGFDDCPENVKEILELIFTQGYKMGSQFVTTYLAKEMLVGQLESIFGKSLAKNDSDESCKSSTTDQILQEFLNNFEEQDDSNSNPNRN